MCKTAGNYNSKSKRTGKLYKPWTAMALQKRYIPIAREVGMFMAEDIRASYIEKKSGHSEEDHRLSAHNFYNTKWNKKFEFELCYNFLKGKGKFLIDFVQTLRNDHAAGEGPHAMAKGSVPGGEKKKKRKNDLSEDEGEKMQGQKLARRLQMEAVAAEAEEMKHKVRIAAEQEKYTKKTEMQQLLFQTEVNGQQLAQEAEENKVMSMDTSHMPAGDR